MLSLPPNLARSALDFAPDAVIIIGGSGPPGGGARAHIIKEYREASTDRPALRVTLFYGQYRGNSGR